MGKIKNLNEWIAGSSAGDKWYTQTAQSDAEYGETVRDHGDRLIKSFIDFIDTGNKPGRTDDNSGSGEAPASPLSEDAIAPSSASAPQSTSTNTTGMGNVQAPGVGVKGSGDTFGDEEEDEDDPRKKKVGIMSYEKYKKWLKKWDNK